jgi:hypothetical protein
MIERYKEIRREETKKSKEIYREKIEKKSSRERNAFKEAKKHPEYCIYPNHTTPNKKTHIPDVYN